MKKTFLIVIASVALLACNTNTVSKDEGSKPVNNIPVDTMEHPDNLNAGKEVPVVTPLFPSMDEAVKSHIRTLLDRYLDIKNAFVNENASAAATASKKMYDALKKFDKSLLTSEQKKVYDAKEDYLKEDAEHIGKKAGDIKHQRLHFSMMSEDMLALVKAFGAGRTLYHNHCPMAKDNQGAMWLSETKEIRNPYFGDKMMTCGTVEEMFQ